MGKEFTIQLNNVKTQINSFDKIYKKMSQCYEDIERISRELNDSVSGVSRPLSTIISNNNELLNSFKQFNSVLEEVVQQYQNTEEQILTNKILQKDINTEKNATNQEKDNSSNKQLNADEAYNKILDLMEQYAQGKIDILSLLSNIASILEYIGDDLDALDDFIKLVGVENAADLTVLGKEIGKSELSSWLSLISRAFENSSAVIDGDIRWDQALRYYGLEILGDLGKDTIVGVTGPYGFAAFAVLDAISISKNGEDAVAWLAHTIDDNTYEEWYQSW